MMKKFVKWTLIILFVLVALALGGVGLYISSIYTGAKNSAIDENVLTSTTLNIAMYDSDNKPIKEENEITHAFANIESLPQYTKDAFISIEDKDFYNHHGVNYKRILKASLNNLKSRSLKEGASTITQQLVKNSYLSSEKTFKRKVKEVAIAQNIEKTYNKDKILEFYLNKIYFGNNCYGIESAANYYFSKNAKDLTLEESCMLAGMIKSPAKYSPIKNYENCITRRNLVLRQMKNDEKIDVQTYNLAKDKSIELNLNTDKINRLNSYSQASLDEAEEILGLPARQIAIKGYKIFTYQNQEKQTALEEAISSQNIESDSAGIVIDNEKSAITAYIGNSNFKVLDSMRQPGSCIKPILVYSPALNEDIIYPCTQLLDEKVTINDYSPKNVGNVYRGYVSARESLSKSINIPAVKVLSYVGIDKAKTYAEEMGIEFDEKDDSYTLALGGMTYGVNIAQLAGAYSTFANNGIYKEPKFVSFITDSNNKLVYINKTESKKVLREDSSYLLTDMLKTCANTGTAKKLSELNCEIASKTGTVGKPNSKENLDAWNVSYTKAQTIAVWLGNLDNTPISYAGGNQPTEIVRNYFSMIEDLSTFEKPNSVVERNIDALELNENHRIMLSSPLMPERYQQSEIFSVFNLPQDVSDKFANIEKVKINSKVENGNAILSFEAKEYESYEFILGDKSIKTLIGEKGEQVVTIPLTESKQEILIKNYYTLSPDIIQEQKISFLRNNSSPKSNKKWYI